MEFPFNKKSFKNLMRQSKISQMLGEFGRLKHDVHRLMDSELPEEMGIKNDLKILYNTLSVIELKCREKRGQVSRDELEKNFRNAIASLNTYNEMFIQEYEEMLRREKDV